jgi:hypothetical protein
MNNIESYDSRLLSEHDLLERFGAGESMTNEEMSLIMGVHGDKFRPYRDKRLQVLLKRRDAAKRSQFAEVMAVVS